jgi:hypothetical protein
MFHLMKWLLWPLCTRATRLVAFLIVIAPCKKIPACRYVAPLGHIPIVVSPEFIVFWFVCLQCCLCRWIVPSVFSRVVLKQISRWKTTWNHSLYHKQTSENECHFLIFAWKNGLQVRLYLIKFFLRDKSNDQHVYIVAICTFPLEKNLILTCFTGS